MWLRQILKFAIPLILVVALVLPIAGCGVTQDKYDALQDEYDALQSQLTSVQNEYNDTKSKLASAQTELDQTRGSNDALQKQASDLEDKLDTILDTQVMRYYNFNYKWWSYSWSLPIPLRTYFYYKELPRPGEYHALVTDSYSDNVMSIISRELRDAALTYDLRKTDVVNLIAAFVCSLPHSDKEATTPFDGYPRYPVETLFDQGGDSEDNSILIAAILSREEYDIVFFRFEQQKHMAVGVNLPAAGGYGWEYQGNKYYYLETTEQNYELGECPYDIRTVLSTVQPVIVPVGH